MLGRVRREEALGGLQGVLYHDFRTVTRFSQCWKQER